MKYKESERGSEGCPGRRDVHVEIGGREGIGQIREEGWKDRDKRKGGEYGKRK